MIIPFYNAIGAQRINSGGGGAVPLVNTKSLVFDGVDDFVSVGNVIDKSKSTPFSISLWVNIPLTISNNTIISKIEDRGGTIWAVGYKLYFNNNLYFSFALDSHFSHQMYVRDNNYWGISDGLTNGWHHIVGTYDGSGLSSGMTLYVDGYDVSFARADTGTGDFDNTGDLYIGGQNYDSTPSLSFTGNIDEPCIIPVELSAVQVLDIYNGVRPSGGGAVDGNWNDGTGVPKDMSSYTPDGWWRNGDNSTYQTPQILMPENTNKDKVSNYSMAFDGTDDYIDCGNGSELQITSDISVSCWFKTTSTGTGMLISKRILGIGTGYGYQLYIGAKKLRFLVTLNGPVTYTATGTTDIDDGQWHHVLGTIDQNNQISIILDGSTEATTSLGSEAFVESNSSLLLGYNQVGASHYYFDGQMDEVAIFDSLESGSTIYNLGTPNDITSLNPVGYWKLGEQARYNGTDWLIPNSISSNYSNFSMAFDGVDDAIQFENTWFAPKVPSATDGNHNGSVSFWFNSNNVVQYEGLIAFNCAFGLDNFRVHFDTSGAFSNGANLRVVAYGSDNAGGETGMQAILYDSGNTINPGSSVDWQPDTWYHVAIVFDKDATDRYIVYVDNVAYPVPYVSGTSVNGMRLQSGVVPHSLPYTSGGSLASNNCAIGSWYANGGTIYGEFSGSIDEFSIYETSLTSSEINSIFNGGQPKEITGASAWYRMGEDASFSTTWNVPDQIGSNDGTSANMTNDDLVGDAPGITGSGTSDNMTIEDREGNAPNSDTNALSYNMDAADVDTDVPS